jgi:hypothetical protein
MRTVAVVCLSILSVIGVVLLMGGICGLEKEADGECLNVGMGSFGAVAGKLGTVGGALASVAGSGACLFGLGCGIYWACFAEDDSNSEDEGPESEGLCA